MLCLLPVPAANCAHRSKTAVRAAALYRAPPVGLKPGWFYTAAHSARTSLVAPLPLRSYGRSMAFSRVPPPPPPAPHTLTLHTHAYARQTHATRTPAHDRLSVISAAVCMAHGVCTNRQCSIDSARAAGALRCRAVRRHDHRRRHSHQGRQRVVHAPAGLAHLSE